MKHYHNTTNEIGEELGQLRIDSETQDKEILLHLKEEYQGKEFDAWTIWRSMLCAHLITSVRRSLNYHLRVGNIVQVFDEEGNPKKITGIRGRKVFVYKLNFTL